MRGHRVGVVDVEAAMSCGGAWAEVGMLVSAYPCESGHGFQLGQYSGSEGRNGRDWRWLFLLEYKTLSKF